MALPARSPRTRPCQSHLAIVRLVAPSDLVSPMLPMCVICLKVSLSLSLSIYNIYIYIYACQIMQPYDGMQQAFGFASVAMTQTCKTKSPLPSESNFLNNRGMSPRQIGRSVVGLCQGSETYHDPRVPSSIHSASTSRLWRGLVWCHQQESISASHEGSSQ